MIAGVGESTILTYGGCVPGASRLVDECLYVGLEMNDMESNNYITRLYTYDSSLNRTSASTTSTNTDMVQVSGIYNGLLDISTVQPDTYVSKASISGITGRIENTIATQDGYAVVSQDGFYHFNGDTLTCLSSDSDCYLYDCGCDSFNGIGAYSICDGSTYTLSTLTGTVIKSASAEYGGFVLIRNGKIYASYQSASGDAVIIIASPAGVIESETIIDKYPIGLCAACSSGDNIVVSRYNYLYSTASVTVYNPDFSESTQLINTTVTRLPFVGIGETAIYTVYTTDDIITNIRAYEKPYADTPITPPEPEELVYGTVHMETTRVMSASPALIFNYNIDVENYTGQVYFKCTLYSDIDLTTEIFTCDSVTSPGLFEVLDVNRVAVYCSSGPVRDIYAVIQLGIEGVAP